MADINLQNITGRQLLALGDGALRGGDYKLALGLYRSALKHAAGSRARILSRIGLAASPTADTPSLLAMLEAAERMGEDVFVGGGLATWRKTLPFFEDERFVELAARHAVLLPLPNWHWNLQTAVWAIRQTRDTPGDLVELGVFKGHTTLFCAEYLDFATWPKTWRLYDTFEGIPADQVDPGWEEVNRQVYGGGAFSFEEVRDRFAHIPNIEVIKGRVPEVLADAPEVISFLHVDMNNATAEIAALDVLFDRVSPGGVVLFDDYGWATARAQYVAERDWMAERGLEPLALPTGQGVLLKR